MQELQKRLTELEDDFLIAYERLKIEEKLAKLAKLEEEVAQSPLTLLQKM